MCQKAGFGKPDKLQNHSNEGKGKEKKKERREVLSSYDSYFEDSF